MKRRVIKNVSANGLFFARERTELEGRHKRNIVVLVGILILAILSIGFANASLKYLQYKMSDPYATCVDVTVDQIGRERSQLDAFGTNNENKIRFGYNETENVYLQSGWFLTSDGETPQLSERSFRVGSPTIDNVLRPTNVIVRQQRPIEENDICVILSQDAIDLLGDSCPVFIREYLPQCDKFISLPVYAIVKNLPSMSHIFISQAYADQILYENASKKDLNSEMLNKDLIICCRDAQVNQIQNTIISHFDSVSVAGISAEGYYITWSSEFSQITVHADCSSRVAYYDSIYSLIDSMFEGVERIYDFSSYSDENLGSDIISPNIVTFYFNEDSLADHVMAFRDELKRSTRYNIDMTSIENLRNLSSISQMSNILSSCIILLSIVFIVVFVVFLLITHFQKIETNLGTFKAFGMSNRKLYGIYMLIVGLMIVVSFVISFIVSWLISCIVQFVAGCRELGYEWIDVFAYQNVALFGCVLLLSLVSVFAVMNVQLRRTPGSLIYHRG